MLDNRLATLAAMVQPCTCCADIGTDHGYLICDLVNTGKCAWGIATDINQKPLEKASREIQRQGLGGRIATVCTDGLTGLGTEVDSVVIAGMGGELIARIVDSWSHGKSTKNRYYLQPMTKAEKLRQYLWESGFTIEMECCCIAGGKAYTVMQAVYKGEKIDYSPVDLWLGRVNPRESPEAMEYTMRLLQRLRRRVAGMAQGQHDPTELVQLQVACEEIDRRTRV